MCGSCKHQDFRYGSKIALVVSTCINLLKKQIWAQHTSTVGTGAEAKAGARDVPISVAGVMVSPVSSLNISHAIRLLTINFRET